MKNEVVKMEDQNVKGKGSSSGINGIKLNLDQPCSCGAGTPITQRAK